MNSHLIWYTLIVNVDFPVIHMYNIPKRIGGGNFDEVLIENEIFEKLFKKLNKSLKSF